MNLMNKSLIWRMIAFSFCACPNWPFYDTILLYKSPIHFLQINRHRLHSKGQLSVSTRHILQKAPTGVPLFRSCRTFMYTTNISDFWAFEWHSIYTVRLNCQTFNLTIIQDFIGWLHANEAKLSSSQTMNNAFTLQCALCKARQNQRKPLKAMVSWLKKH